MAISVVFENEALLPHLARIMRSYLEICFRLGVVLVEFKRDISQQGKIFPR